MDETQVQGVPAGETPREAQRSLTTTIIETAAAVKLLDDMVPDAYSAVKGAVSDVVDRIRDRGPDDHEPGPEADPPS